MQPVGPPHRLNVLADVQVMYEPEGVEPELEATAAGAVDSLPATTGVDVATAATRFEDVAATAADVFAWTTRRLDEVTLRTEELGATAAADAFFVVAFGFVAAFGFVEVAAAEDDEEALPELPPETVPPLLVTVTLVS